MLPPRMKNTKKPDLSIQMALIQEADSEYDVHEKDMSPTRKTMMRSQVL